MKEIINAPKAPKPIGPYSHSVKTQGPLLFISGQIAIDNDGNMVGIDIATQTAKVLENLGIILESAGCTYDHVAKCTVLLKNMEDFSEMNLVYAKYFENSKPARAAYQVSQLPKDALVEIEAIAVVPSELEE